MKKTISMILVLATVFALAASIAVADEVQNSFGYSTILCQANQERSLNQHESAYKTAKPGVLYVRHYLHGNFGGVYTNYFKANRDRLSKTNLVGGDWMAPDTANYVRSSSILSGQQQRWYAWGRANTDYGLTSIVISGYSHCNG